MINTTSRFEMKDFYKKALSQISIWSWAAIILPIVSLAGLFFLEFIGLHSYYHVTLVIGATTMVALSVIWWWWALYTIARVTLVLGETLEKIEVVETEVKELKKDIQLIK